MLPPRMCARTVRCGCCSRRANPSPADPHPHPITRTLTQVLQLLLEKSARAPNDALRFVYDFYLHMYGAARRATLADAAHPPYHKPQPEP